MSQVPQGPRHVIGTVEERPQGRHGLLSETHPLPISEEMARRCFESSVPDVGPDRDLNVKLQGVFPERLRGVEGVGQILRKGDLSRYPIQLSSSLRTSNHS